MSFAVTTGLDSFVNPEEIGPMYPFPGLEVLFFGVALFLWLAWHFLQARGETREHRDAVEMYEQLGLEEVMRQGGSALAGPEDQVVQPPDLDASRDGIGDPVARQEERAGPPPGGPAAPRG